MERSFVTTKGDVTTRTISDVLPEARRQVLEVHRVLVDAQRREYEKVHGRQSPGALFDNLVLHPLFAWLRPLTSLIAHMDEVLASDERTPLADAECVALVRALLRPLEDGDDFQRRYAEMIQREPAVAFAHGTVSQVLARAAALQP